MIGDFVWADANNNGIQDAGEPGFAGVLITLFNGSGIPVATAVTDANGRYLFPNVAPGTYSMVFTNLPTGVTFTVSNVGDDNFDSDVLGTSITGIVVTTTTVNISFDAGLNGAVTLASKAEFTAYKKNTTAELNWKMGADINEVKEFVVERSTDGSNFAAISTLSADNRTTTYQQIDQQPNAGVNYYRIKIIYLTGEVKYTEVRILIFGGKGSIIVFPNPATEMINIQLPDNWQNKAVTINLINQAGQIVNTMAKAKASQVETLVVNKLPAGIYILRIMDDNGNKETRKLIVNTK